MHFHKMLKKFCFTIDIKIGECMNLLQFWVLTFRQIYSALFKKFDDKQLNGWENYQLRICFIVKMCDTMQVMSK